MNADAPFDDVRLPSDPGLIDDLEKAANQVYMLVGELRSLTQWDERLLLKHLGCEPAAPRPSEADPEQLMNHSLAYLTWVRDLCVLVDRPVDRHDILHAAYELCAAAGGSLDDRVKRCVDACNATGQDGLSAHELVGLGELAKARSQGMAGLDGGPRALTSHLHPRRLQWLFAGHSALEREIGVNVGRRMLEHLQGCERCNAVAHELKLADPQLPPAA